MRILLTGAKGFTGHYVKQALISDQHTVIELQSNLLDTDSLKSEVGQCVPDAIIHLAGIASVDHGRVNDFYQVNLIGTRNLLEAVSCGVPNISNIILASSANVYGNHASGVLSESIFPVPLNDYALSKFAMEKMASLWFERLPICVVRPFNYVGVGQSDQFVIPKIVNHFRQRSNTIQLGNIDVYREYNDVRIIADIYAKLVSQQISSQTVNMCSGKGYSLRKVIDFCESITGHQIQVDINPEFVRKNEVISLTGCNKKLVNMIGEIKSQSLCDTLSWMLESKE